MATKAQPARATTRKPVARTAKNRTVEANNGSPANGDSNGHNSTGTGRKPAVQVTVRDLPAPDDIAEAAVPDAAQDERVPYSRDFVQVTPRMAKALLESIHPDQRNHRPARVEQYANDIRHGNWREDTEDAILIDWYGRVVDGQNRLRAIVEANRPIKVWIVRGVDPAVMRVKDTNAPRTVADSLRIAGTGSGLTSAELSVLGAIARRQMHWEAGRRSAASMKGTGHATHTDIAKILELQPDIYGATKIGIDASRSTRPALIGAAPYGFFWLHANRISSELAYAWQTYWLTPSELPGASPILYVRERLYRSKIAQAGSNYGANRADVLKPDEALALLIKAWNLHLAGRKANSQKMQIARGKLNNDNFPRFLTEAEAVAAADREERETASRTRRGSETS